MKNRDSISTLAELDELTEWLLNPANKEAIIELSESTIETETMMISFSKGIAKAVEERVMDIINGTYYTASKKLYDIKKNYTIISSTNEFKKAIQHLNDYRTFSYDVESTGLNVRKDKVIGVAFCGKVGTAFYLPIYKFNKDTQELDRLENIPTIWVKQILTLLAKKELLMWNASYDIRITKNDLKVDLIDALFADIMLMKHTLEEEGNFSLKDVAKDFQAEIGLDVDKEANEEQLELKENIIANGGSVTKTNYELYKADTEVIGKYACADVDLTLRLGLYFSDRLAKENLEEFFYDKEVMPLYKEVTILMEEKGIALDMDLIIATKKQIEVEIDEHKKLVMDDLLSNQKVQKYLKQKIREEVPVSNKGTFAQAICSHFSANLPKTNSGKYSITTKTVNTLAESPLKSFLLSGKESDLDSPEVVEKVVNDIYLEKNQELINIQSKQQMATIAFEVLGYKAQSKTSKGASQFDDDAIQYLEAEGVKWAALLGDYNRLNKIKGTYIDRFLEEQEDGVFYPSFFQHRTISGRYGSNMQQLPRVKEDGQLSPTVLKYNNLIRKFFIAGKGRKFIDNDYESLEPHVFAHVSGDEGLRDIFRLNYDFYSTIAIATEKLSQYSADKKAENYLGKLNKPKRQSAKGYSLGVPYGMKSYALGKTLDIPEEQASELIEGYLNAYPKLREWMITSEKQAKSLGYVTTETGRVRHLPKVKELYDKFGDDLLDHKKRSKYFKEYGKEQVMSWYKDYKNGLNNSKNVQIQGLSASIVNMAAIQINRRFKEEGIDGHVALQIHDQLVMNIPDDKNTKKALDIVQDIMENNYKLSLKLKAFPQLADNLMEGH